jgi:hypothetical protein
MQTNMRRTGVRIQGQGGQEESGDEGMKLEMGAGCDRAWMAVRVLFFPTWLYLLS